MPGKAYECLPSDVIYTLDVFWKSVPGGILV